MKYEINEKNVKLLGRTTAYRGVCWCGLSGTGIAFSVKGTYAAVTLMGDDSTNGRVTEGPARIGIYMNGERIMDKVLQKPEETVTIFKGNEKRTAEIVILKLSECAMSTMGIREIETDGKIVPVPEKQRKIEFIGDSITCGFGVDMEDPETVFRTDTEDVTRAYAYKTARALQADYSMVSYSGYGIYSGYSDTDSRSLEARVPLYYEKCGFSYAKPFGELELTDVIWDFKKFVPQLVVVNLGTNDDSYCRGLKEREDAYSKEYAEFLKVIRKNNPQAKMLCTLGLMGERLCPAMERAVELYRKETGDENADYLFLREQREEDGRVSAYHPTEKSHEKAASALVEKIRIFMGWD